MYGALAGDVSVRQGSAVIRLFEFGGSDRFAILVADKTKKPENQPIAFGGAFFQALGSSLAVIEENADLGKQAKIELNRLKDKMDRILSLMQHKPAKQHSIQNYLTVELHDSPDDGPREKGRGVLIVRVWLA